MALPLAISFPRAAEFPSERSATGIPAEAGPDETPSSQTGAYALTGGGSGYITRGGEFVRAWGDLAQR